MSRFYSYLNSAEKVLSLYKGEEPFSSFLKKYFAVNKKYGSKDRKQVSHLCYCYFRLGKSAADRGVAEQILTGLFLSATEPDEMLKTLRPEWNEKAGMTLKQKMSFLNTSFSVERVFPWKDELSAGIDAVQFNASFFVQPGLFLRIRPGKEKSVISKLTDAGTSFNQLSANCISLSNATKVEDVLELNREVIIQDYNSQRVGENFKTFKAQTADLKPVVWDCCAASGGKSVMAKDILGNIDLTVSDIRDSILVNLKKRFKQAGIIRYKSFVADLTHSVPIVPGSPFDLIIADVPCTGSGTWSRTPEQLYYFREEKIEEYAALQKKIVSNVISQLQQEGYLVYITCSVFRKENEENVDYLSRKYDLKLIKQEVLAGYDKKADSMFVALMRREL